MDEWGWEHLRPWIDRRSEMPIGALLCVINVRARLAPTMPASAGLMM